ncbi:PIN domain-containing protein [Skermania piniformis]|nr:PIN domain-containing protein [Skermania piniformis]
MSFAEIGHRDPFDRLIIAQAITEHLTVVTADPRFTAYGIPLIPA